METKVKPFIPEYIPAVGEVDAFLKIPRPDGKPEHLGLDWIDEYFKKTCIKYEQKKLFRLVN